MLNGGSFYDYYQTSDGRWLSVGSLEPQFSARLLEALNLSDLQKLTMSQKPEHQQELKAAIQQKISEKPLSEWQDVFSKTDACVEPVLTIAEAAEHPQLKARAMVGEVDRGDGVVQFQLSSPIKFCPLK
jgi:crotonobetainyl-CoA:carnitine CoA-transferase CaiB-like acyl-CoA transferase